MTNEKTKIILFFIFLTLFNNNFLHASEVNKGLEFVGYMFCILNIFLSFVIFGVSGFQSSLARIISFSFIACILIASNATIIYTMIHKHFLAIPLYALSVFLLILFTVISIKDIKKAKTQPQED